MAERDSCDTFDEIIAGAPAELHVIVFTLRALISSLDKSLVEIVWPRQKIASYGVGPKKMSQHYAYIAIHSSHINLGFYHGASLTDPSSQLKGTGKKLRHIQLRDEKTARSSEIKKLLKQAIAERRPYQ